MFINTNLPTVASHRIDPMEEYIRNLEQNKKKSGSPARSGTVGRPTIPDLLRYKMTKSWPWKNLASLNLELWNDFFAKKGKKHEKIELRQAPIMWYSNFVLRHIYCINLFMSPSLSIYTDSHILRLYFLMQHPADSFILSNLDFFYFNARHLVKNIFHYTSP